MPPKTLIIGAAGAVGKRLTNALARAGTEVVAADRMNFIPSTIRFTASAFVGGVDVRDKDALMKLFKKHADEQTTVWNLAAPLSVETALTPELAESVVIGGMKNTLEAMKSVGCRRICFTDSIGSFGASSPRVDVSARWLVENPTQDPGSDYGIQKRRCRELLDEFYHEGGDPRIAILPGVLHNEPVWGNGTTEYALDAMLAASQSKQFSCPIDPDVLLPMVVVDDLMRGLVAIQNARERELKEPERMYNIPGLSFSPNQLFKEIRQFKPNFDVVHGPECIHPNMDTFAKLWPDSLSGVEALRDLDYEPDLTLPAMVAGVLTAHSGRRLGSKAAFRSIDTCESGRVNDYMLEKYVRKYLVRGRERSGYFVRRQDMVYDVVGALMVAMDVDKDGIVSMDDFLSWSNLNSLEGFVEDFYTERVASMKEADKRRMKSHPL